MVGGNVSASYFFSQNVALTGGADAYLEWTKSKDSEFRSILWSIVPSLGVEIEL